MGATQVEQMVLEKFGLRWAVLAAWVAEAKERRLTLPKDVLNLLEEARLKLASGCFTSGEVGIALNRVESTLTMLDASSASPRVDHWTGLVGAAMADELDTALLLGFEPVRVLYNEVRFGSCGPELEP